METPVEQDVDIQNNDIPGVSNLAAKPASPKIPKRRTQRVIRPRRRRFARAKLRDSFILHYLRMEERRAEADLMRAKAFATMSEQFHKMVIALTSIATAILSMNVPRNRPVN